MKSIHLVNTLLVVFLLGLVYPVHAQVNHEAIEFKKTVEPHQLVQGLHNTRGKTSLQKRFSGDENENAVMFKKTVEPTEHAGVQNVRSKDALQLKFFPDNTGLIEFFEAPEHRPGYGFRMIRTEDSRYLLEIKEVSNWQDIKNRIDEAFPLQIPSKTLSREERDEMNKTYKENARKRAEAWKAAILEYKIMSKNISVSDAFANALHGAFIYSMRNYDNRGHTFIQFGGSQVTLRCTVENELWSFYTASPIDKVGLLTDISNAIFKEAIEKGGVDEDKYMKQLRELVKDEQD